MIKVTDLEYWMDPLLKAQLDNIAYNMLHDFDAVIPVSGDGMVRVGKSVLAQQIGYYIAWKHKTPFTLANIVFSGKELIEMAQKLPKNSVLIYDEARGELDSKKVMENITKNLMDFFAECGMLNHCIILVCPDFFELPKGVALNRSEFLVNVIRTSSLKKDKEGIEVVKFERGVFEFYNRRGKKILYIQGKKDYNDYGVGKKCRSFFGNFHNQYIVDKTQYENKKAIHLGRDKVVAKDETRFGALLCVASVRFTQEEMAQGLKDYGVHLTRERLSQLMSNISAKGGLLTKVNVND
jgi:hypothetical protein